MGSESRGLAALAGHGAPTSVEDIQEAYSWDGHEDLTGPVEYRVKTGIAELYKRGITAVPSLCMILNVPPNFVTEALTEYRQASLARFQRVDIMRAELLMELEGVQRRIHDTLDYNQPSVPQRSKLLEMLVALITNKGKFLGLHESKVLVSNEQKVTIDVEDPDGMAKLAKLAGIPEHELRDFAEDFAVLQSKQIQYGT